MLSTGFEVVLLTGFLGSGKTTLLKSFLASTDAWDVGVVVNEIGEIDVDGAVLAQSAEKVPLALLSNGCICCAADGDLAGTIAMLQEERARRSMAPLRRVIVETSGAARPGPVLRGLRLLGAFARITCVCTFDAQGWQRAMQTQEGRAQIAGAHRVVLTKLECVNASQQTEAIGAAREANAICELVALVSPEERARSALAEIGHQQQLRVHSPESFPHGASKRKITTAILRFGGAVSYEELMEWLDNAAGLLGNRLFRTKGLVAIGDANRRMLVQGVGTTFAQPVAFPGDSEQSFLVVIGEQLQLRELRSIEPALDVRISLGGLRNPLAIGRSLSETLDLAEA